MRRTCGHDQHGTYWTDRHGNRVKRGSEQATVLRCAWCGKPFEVTK